MVFQVLELLRRRGQCLEENFDALGLLQTLCLVKMDTVDGNAAAKKQAKPRAPDPPRSSSAPNAEAAESRDDSPNPDTDKQDKEETEMKGNSAHRRGFAITRL